MSRRNRFVIVGAVVGVAELVSPGRPVFAQQVSQQDYTNCQQMDDVDRGIAACDRIASDRTQSDADRAVAYSWLGHDHSAKNAFEDAVRDFGEAIKIDPQNASLYASRAIANLRKGDRAAAIADYRKANAMDPSKIGSLVAGNDEFKQIAEASAVGPRPSGKYVNLPPPVISIPFDHYIVHVDVADPQLIYDTLKAPAVDYFGRGFTLDDIRDNQPVRQLMPSVLLDGISDDGSAEISSDHANKLRLIADGIKRAISRNPAEMFLIEGHTNDNNSSLSVRRAETTAKLLIEQFQVPAKNLTTQGYTEQARTSPVIIRRITPLLAGQN